MVIGTPLLRRTHFVEGEPARVFQFVIDARLVRLGLRGKAQHQRRRERPRLRGGVAAGAHAHARLLGHFAHPRHALADLFGDHALLLSRCGDLLVANSGGNNLIWNGTIANDTTFVPNASATYVVSGESSLGCIGSDTLQVFYGTFPDLNAGQDQSVCFGDEVILYGTGGIFMSWSNNIADSMIEQMRREGYELTVGKPQVVTKKIDGKIHEPVEDLTIDAPEEYLGAITQLMAARKGRMKGMSNHGTGWVRMEFLVPSRGLIGFRTEFLTTTRGTGIANAISAGYEPWFGDIVTRNNGSMVADRAGVVTPFAMIGLQERGSFFVEPTQEVYAGMVVGENSRADDMEVNITKEKKLTNMRASSSDEFQSLTPPRKLSLEECLEFAREDECVEVTPEATRIRKVELDPNLRARATAAKKRASAD